MEGVELLTGVVFPYINFAIFLVLATFMFRRPIKNALSAKRDSYQTLVKKASLAKEEAEARQRDLQLRLANIDQEIGELRQQAKIQAGIDAKTLISNAEKLAEHLQREAHRIAAAEVAAAKVELQHEIMKLVKQQVIDKVQKKLDASRQQLVIHQNLVSLGNIRAEKLT